MEIFNVNIKPRMKQTVIKFITDCTIKLSLVGGGGSGGIGCIIDHCYIYGSGGAAGEDITKIINVECGEKWIITIGKGGSSIDSTHGNKTHIKSVITKPCGTEIVKFMICVEGGCNGAPHMEQVMTIINNNEENCHEIDLKKLIRPTVISNYVSKLMKIKYLTKRHLIG